MKVEKNMLPGSKVELIIEQETKEVVKFRKKVISDAGQHVEVKGFRKGAKIPEEVIVRQVGEDRITQMTIEKAIEGVYRETLRKENLMPVSEAEIKDVMSQDPLQVKIEVEVFPVIEVKESYKKIKLKKAKLSVSAKEVEAALEDIQTRFTHFHETPADKDEGAKMGDRVTIDTDGYEKDVKLDATSMRDYPIVLGGNILVPGFEEDIAGMRTGEIKDIDVTFPKDYHNKDFAGKKTKFKVTVKKREHAHKPEFTPEFIEQLRGKKLDLDGFKKLIKSEILETKEVNDGMQREMQLVDELMKHTTLDIGEKLLERQLEGVYKEICENISKDGIKVEDYLASLGLTEAEYKEKHVKETALKRLQGELILAELIKKEKIEVADDEMQKEIDTILARFESEDVLKRLKELYVPGNNYYEELRRRVAMKKLIESFFEA